jgi:hypothetical protein
MQMSTSEKANPFLVENEAMLRKVGTDIDGWSLSAHYLLTADINLNNKEWTPIGTWDDNDISLRKPFIGTFDGGGKTISGLYINNPSANQQGFFGITGKDGIVKNLAVSGSVTGNNDCGGVVGVNGNSSSIVEDCCFNGSVTGNSCVGGVLGVNVGTAKNCYSTANVTGKNTVGGVVGNNGGTAKNCYSTANVTGKNTVGGVVGINASTMKICYSTASVTGKNTVGGIVGHNSGIAENCYSIGSVTVEDGFAGGVAGVNLDKGKVQNCYATGNIAGKSSIGGLIGHNFAGTMQNCVALNASLIRTHGTNQAFARLAAGNGDDSNNAGVLTNSYALACMKFVDETTPKEQLTPEARVCFKFDVDYSNLSKLKKETGVDLDLNAISNIQKFLSYINGTEITATQAGTQSWWTSTSRLGWDFDTVWLWDSTVNLPILRSFQMELRKEQKQEQLDSADPELIKLRTERIRIEQERLRVESEAKTTTEQKQKFKPFIAAGIGLGALLISAAIVIIAGNNDNESGSTSKTPVAIVEKIEPNYMEAIRTGLQANGKTRLVIETTQMPSYSLAYSEKQLQITLKNMLGEAKPNIGAKTLVSKITSSKSDDSILLSVFLTRSINEIPKEQAIIVEPNEDNKNFRIVLEFEAAKTR